MLEDILEPAMERKHRPRVYVDNSITPCDVDNIVALGIEKKHRMHSQKERMMRRYLSKQNQALERHLNITKINDLSVSILEDRASQRYQPNE